MPQRIVDILEAIQIDELHCNFGIITRGCHNRVADSILQQHPVRQIGEDIVLG
jgi:hypothetical protein